MKRHKECETTAKSQGYQYILPISDRKKAPLHAKIDWVMHKSCCIDVVPLACYYVPLAHERARLSIHCACTSRKMLAMQRNRCVCVHASIAARHKRSVNEAKFDLCSRLKSKKRFFNVSSAKHVIWSTLALYLSHRSSLLTIFSG